MPPFPCNFRGPKLNSFHGVTAGNMVLILQLQRWSNPLFPMPHIITLTHISIPVFRPFLILVWIWPCMSNLAIHIPVYVIRTVSRYLIICGQLCLDSSTFHFSTNTKCWEIPDQVFTYHSILVSMGELQLAYPGLSNKCLNQILWLSIQKFSNRCQSTISASWWQSRERSLKSLPKSDQSTENHECEKQILCQPIK